MVATWGDTRAGGLLLLSATAMLAVAVYRLYLHPLAHIPGPFMGRITPLFLYTISFLGIEGRVLRHCHTTFGSKVIRVAPNSLSISDSEAIHTIYVAGGGFQKDSRYVNFNLGSVVSIFSATDTEYRNARAKPVAPLFAASRLRKAFQPDSTTWCSIAEFLGQLSTIKNYSQKADVLDLSARLSIDVVTSCLMGKTYGGLREYAAVPIEARRELKLSINPFIKAVVAFGRFSLLPNWLFRIVYTISTGLFSDKNKEATDGLATLDAFVHDLVVAAESTTAPDSYQRRLLAAGIPVTEVKEQCKAIVFAGADSVAVILATLIFHLVQNPHILVLLQAEVSSSATETVQGRSLPYLRAVINEGLRLGMANPTRLTRVVPPSGLRVENTYIPAGTVVGVAPYVVHHDEEVFPDPFAFRPERWLAEGLRRPGMERSMLPFGAGLRACIGKNLAQVQLYETVKALASSRVLEGARTLQSCIDLIEWFNAEIRGHKLEIEWKDIKSLNQEYNYLGREGD
jgi:cytochrome P450